MKSPASPKKLPRARAIGASDVPPHLLVDGTPRRPDMVTPARWRDPDDTIAMERDASGRRHQKTIAGFRAIDPLDRLPCDAAHRKAARRLRVDWERGSGSTSGGSDAGRVDGGSRDHDSVAGQMEARRRYQDAVQALGQRACAFVLPIVLSGWTVADLVGRHGGNAMAVQGRVMAGLDRLAEWYEPPDRAAVSIEPPASPILIDPVSGLPWERLGRIRRS